MAAGVAWHTKGKFFKGPTYMYILFFMYSIFVTIINATNLLYPLLCLTLLLQSRV